MKYIFVFLVFCTSCHSPAPTGANEPSGVDGGSDADIVGFPDPNEIGADAGTADNAARAAHATGDPLDDLTAGRIATALPVHAADGDGGYDPFLRGRIEAASAPRPTGKPPIIRDPPHTRPPGLCDPPFTIDSAGHKMYKTECL